MPGKAAFDTNIFIYSIGGGHDETHGSPQRRAQAASENRKATIARKIVAEPSMISVRFSMSSPTWHGARSAYLLTISPQYWMT